MVRLTEQQYFVLDMDILDFIKNEIDSHDSRTRLVNAILGYSGIIEKVRDLWSLKYMNNHLVTRHPTRRLRNVGPKCERLLESALEKHGLSFDMHILGRLTQIQFNESTAREIMGGVTPGKIKTRDGFDVTIIRWDIDSSFPIGGIVHLGDRNDYLRQWTTEGKGDWRRNVTTNYDLVLEVEGGDNGTV